MCCGGVIAGLVNEQQITSRNPPLKKFTKRFHGKKKTAGPVKIRRAASISLWSIANVGEAHTRHGKNRQVGGRGMGKNNEPPFVSGWTSRHCASNPSRNWYRLVEVLVVDPKREQLLRDVQKQLLETMRIKTKISLSNFVGESPSNLNHYRVTS